MVIPKAFLWNLKGIKHFWIVIPWYFYINSLLIKVKICTGFLNIEMTPNKMKPVKPRRYLSGLFSERTQAQLSEERQSSIFCYFLPVTGGKYCNGESSLIRYINFFPSVKVKIVNNLTGISNNTRGCIDSIRELSLTAPWFNQHW